MTGAPRRAGVLGDPIDHSLSPALHRAAYAALGLDWEYDRYRVDVAGLPGFVASCGPEWAGLSLTMPLKHAVLSLLDDVDDLVELSGAANTLVWRDGRRLGLNTDVTGLEDALRDADAVVDRACVLGAGATAASALVALDRLGADEVVVLARRPEAIRELGRVADRLELRLEEATWPGDRPEGFSLDADVVVSTLPAGASQVLLSLVPQEPGTLFDVVYDPWPTPLAAAWERAGGQVLGGRDLLVRQAVGQVEAMTGLRVAPELLYAALD